VPSFEVKYIEMWEAKGCPPSIWRILFFVLSTIALDVLPKIEPYEAPSHLVDEEESAMFIVPLNMFIGPTENQALYFQLHESASWASVRVSFVIEEGIFKSMYVTNSPALGTCAIRVLSDGATLVSGMTKSQKIGGFLYFAPRRNGCAIRNMPVRSVHYNDVESDSVAIVIGLTASCYSDDIRRIVSSFVETSKDPAALIRLK